MNFHSAADDLSGVYSLIGTLDGIYIPSGTTSTINTYGTHIFRVDAQDYAGNPVVKEVELIAYPAGGGGEKHRR